MTKKLASITKLMLKNTENCKSSLLFALKIGAVLLFLMVLIFKSMLVAIHIPIDHIDGAFQTASGLFRLDSGEMPGRDFYPYLGVGPFLLIFPFFKFVGGTLSASVFAVHFVIFIACWLAVSVLYQLIFRPRTTTTSLLCGAIIFLLFLFLLNNIPSIEKAIKFGFEPGNSLRPLRAFIPYLIGILSYYLIKRVTNTFKRSISAGLLIGIAMLWSNDFAIPTAGIFSIFYCIFFFLNEKDSWKKSVFVFCITALLAWLTLLSLITAGNPVELLKYNFFDVARDQWWYFASYSYSDRIFSIIDLKKIFSKANYHPLIVLVILAITVCKTKKLEHILLALIGLTLFLGGTLASVGGHLGYQYFSAFYFWGATVVFLASLKIGQYFLIKNLTFNLTRVFPINLFVLASVFISLIIFANHSWSSYQTEIAVVKNNTNKLYVKELDGYIDAEWADYIHYIRKNKDAIVIADYWGIWNSLTKKFPPWPVDAVIHALGEVRDEAKTALVKADIMVTTRYTASPHWQPWIISQDFWFYEDLLKNWSPDFISPKSIIWKKNNAHREYESVNCRIAENAKYFYLETKNPGFYKVRVEYSASGPGRYLVMLQNNFSYVGGSDGYVSLDPKNSSTTIPVLITEHSSSTFATKTIGPPGIKFVLKSCVAQKISSGNNDLLYSPSLN